MTKPNEGPNIVNIVIQIQIKMILGSEGELSSGPNASFEN